MSGRLGVAHALLPSAAMAKGMWRIGWLRFPAVLLVFACSSSGQKPGGLDAGGTGGDKAGTGGQSATGGASGGATATGGAAGGALVVCSNSAISAPGAIANPADFSVNAETGAMDQHTLVMSRGDMIRQVTMYVTGGNADHQHEFRFTTAELAALSAGQSVVVTTAGPPLNAATGHSHTVTVRPCGVTTASTVGGLTDAGTTTVACATAVGAIANPPDFSTNPETNAMDDHFLIMNQGDLSRGQSTYFTGGAADHQHQFTIDSTQRMKLMSGQSIAATTVGPPLNAATGHGHTATIWPCAVP